MSLITDRSTLNICQPISRAFAAQVFRVVDKQSPLRWTKEMIIAGSFLVGREHGVFVIHQGTNHLFGQSLLLFWCISAATLR
jgi:hypothetical protein